VLLSLCRASCCIAPIAGRAGKGDKSTRDAAEYCGRYELGEEEGKGMLGEGEARQSRGLLTADVYFWPAFERVQLIRWGAARGENF
jgi:hypothetical protein